MEIKEEQNVSLAPLAKVTIINILHHTTIHKHLAGEGGGGVGGTYDAGLGSASTTLAVAAAVTIFPIANPADLIWIIQVYMFSLNSSLPVYYYQQYNTA